MRKLGELLERAFLVIWGVIVAVIAAYGWIGMAVLCVLAGGVIYIIIRLHSSNDESSSGISEIEFVEARNYLAKNRKQLALKVLDSPLYKDAKKLASNIPLLYDENWVPDQPIRIRFSDSPGSSEDDAFLHTTFIGTSPDYFDAGTPGGATSILPSNPDGNKPFTRYSDAVKLLAKPGKFDNDISYRLATVAPKAGEAFTLTFMRSDYFSYQDTCEILCYEAALFSSPDITNHKFVKKLKLRKKIGKWKDFSNRHSIAGVDTLFVIQDPETGERRFLFLKRGQNRTASSMGTLSVVPAGEFQPSGGAEDKIKGECKIWLTFLREAAEEIWLMEEAQTQNEEVLSLEVESPLKNLYDLEGKEKLKLFFLGVCVEALSLKAEILTACVIDKKAFYEVAEKTDWQIPSKNREGDILLSHEGGFLFEDKVVKEFLEDHDMMSSAAMGCLYLGWKHEKLLRL